MRQPGLPLPHWQRSSGLFPHLQRKGKNPHRLRSPRFSSGDPTMDCRIQTAQTTDPPNFPARPGPDPITCQNQAPQSGKILGVGEAFFRTIGHFWPKLNDRLEQLPETRFVPMITYEKRFLAWWGLLLFCFKLTSRRQLDFDLRDLELKVLENLNRLAGTKQSSLPVHKTLDHFLGHVGSTALDELRAHCIRQLIRNKVLDDIRLDGEFVVATDGTGYL